MNILIVSPSIIYGGGESYLIELEKVLLSLNCNLTFFLSNKRLFDNLESKRKQLFNFYSTNQAGIFLIKKINNEILNNDYDYVILNGLPEIGVYSKFIKKKNSIIIVVCHSNEEWLATRAIDLGIKHFVKRFFIHGFDKYIDKLVILNNIAQRNVQSYHSLSLNSIKLYTGIKPVLINNQEERSGVIFGRIGRLIDGKGNENLLRAFYSVYKLNPTIRLIFAGVGDKMTHLKKLVFELGLDEAVSFIGIVPTTEFFSKIDCMVSPSLSEAFPMVILESMSCQVPIISTNIGGVPEILKDGISARLIEPNNIFAIEDALTDYIDNRGKYIIFAQNAYDRYKKDFSLSAFSNRWKNLLSKEQ